jgi:hypothetical protein
MRRHFLWVLRREDNIKIRIRETECEDGNRTEIVEGSV